MPLAVCFLDWREYQLLSSGQIQANLQFAFCNLHFAMHFSDNSNKSSDQPAKLGGVQELVGGTGGEQLWMSSDRQDAAGVHHHDPIGDFQGVEPVRDDEGGPAAHEFP